MFECLLALLAVACIIWGASLSGGSHGSKSESGFASRRRIASYQSGALTHHNAHRQAHNHISGRERISQAGKRGGI